jgi:hypothetical protein
VRRFQRGQLRNQLSWLRKHAIEFFQLGTSQSLNI